MLTSLKRYMLLALLFKANLLYSQDLTGTWEGSLGGFQFLQVNIVQVDNILCGNTWDHLFDNSLDFCKAYFTGSYDSQRKRWILTGTSFFANSGDHSLMRLVLYYKNIGGEKILRGKEIDPTSDTSFLTLFFGQTIYLSKLSNTPNMMTDNMKECMKAKKPMKDDLKIKKDIVKLKTADSIKKIIVPVKPLKIGPADTLKEIKRPVVPIIVIKDSSLLLTQMIKRKNTEMSHLVVDEKNITLEVFDNGIIDADTVSIFYNGKLILSHKRLSEKPIVIPISLDEKTAVHEIILFAENLGSIPPNTALVVIHAGNKRYELYASSSLTENAVITFEYKMK